MVMATEGCQQPIGIRQRVQERHIVTGLAVVSSALPPDLFSVDARFPAGINARRFPEVIRRSDGYVEERQRRNGLVILLGEIRAGFLEPVDSLDRC